MWHRSCIAVGGRSTRWLLIGAPQNQRSTCSRERTFGGNPMSEAIDILDPARPKQVAIIASNPCVSKQTGWPIGFWWSELAHPYWEFAEHGYKIDIFSPDGGKLDADGWSDPRDES